MASKPKPAESEADKPKTRAAPAAAGSAAIEQFSNYSPLRKANRISKTAQELLDSIPESGTCTVGCKLPRGIYMRIHTMIEREEPMPAGQSRTERIAMQIGEPVRLKGYAVPANKRPLFPIIGDFGLTENVDAAYFRQFIKENMESDLVQRGLIFCHKDMHAAQDIADERKDLVCGFEPGNPDGDYRAPKRNHQDNLSELEPYDAKKM